VDSELVNRIVKESLAALGQAQSGPAAMRAGETWRERTAANGAAVTPQPAPAGRVFLTADALRRRVAASKGARVVELAWNETLTPNAMDHVQQMHLEVRRKERAPAERENTQAADRAQTAETIRTKACRSLSEADEAQSFCNCPLGLVISRGDAKVAAVLELVRREGANLVEFQSSDCAVRNLTALCEGVSAGTVARGLVIVPYAAGAMALAGRFRGVRPVQGTRLASVEAAIRQFNANLLVIEHAFTAFHEMRAMIRVFAAGAKRPATDKTLMDAIGRLDRA